MGLIQAIPKACPEKIPRWPCDTACTASCPCTLCTVPSGVSSTEKCIFQVGGSKHATPMSIQPSSFSTHVYCGTDTLYNVQRCTLAKNMCMRCCQWYHLQQEQLQPMVTCQSRHWKLQCFYRGHGLDSNRITIAGKRLQPIQPVPSRMLPIAAASAI